MAPTSAIDHLTNPLVTAEQLVKLKASDDEDTPSVRFAQFQLTSAAGILLRLTQEVIAHAIVLLQRFIMSSRPEDRKGFSHKTYSAASIYIAAKISATPVSARSVINVYAYLLSKASPLKSVQSASDSSSAVPRDYYVSEGTYERDRQQLFTCENTVLVGLGFNTRVALPYTMALTYMQVLGVSSSELAQRVFEYLNSGLLSPQFLYLTHQPNTLAVGAIYLAARETGAKLVEQNWWEVFDVDREDLGFLVLSFGSVAGFAQAEGEKWKRKSIELD